MANDQSSDSGGALGALGSAVGALALWRASNQLSDQPPTTVTSDDPASLADEFTVDEPDGGAKRLVWKFDRYQRANGWLGFPLGVVKKFAEDKAGLLAALVAYFGFFSIFPLMIAFISILGFVFDGDLERQAEFVDAAASQIPVVGGDIAKIAEDGAISGSITAIVLPVLIALWSGLKMIDAMQNGLNDVWDIPPVDRPNLVKKRARSILMLLVLGGGIVGTVVVSSLATYIDAIPGGGKFGIWAGSAAVSVLLYWVAFQLLTDRKLPWSDLLPGAIFGGIAWWALQTFGTPYIARIQDSAEEYGSFAAIIALLTFLFIASQLSLLGAEVSAVRSRGLWPRSYMKGDLTEADIRSFGYQAESTKINHSYDVVLRPSRHGASSE